MTALDVLMPTVADASKKEAAGKGRASMQKTDLNTF